jgi:hypothetical protein
MSGRTEPAPWDSPEDLLVPSPRLDSVSCRPGLAPARSSRVGAPLPGLALLGLLILPLLAPSAAAADLAGSYRHPSGLAMAHPADWPVVVRGESVVFGPAPGRELPLCVAFTVEAEGVARIDDPRVGPHLLELLRSEAPAAVPDGDPMSFPTPLGEAMIHGFREGNRHHRVYAVLLGDEALLLDFIRRADDPAADSLADAMVATLGRVAVTGERDQLLVGAWRKTTRSQTDGRGGTVSGETTLVLVFEADGRVLRSTESRLGGALDGLSVIAAARSGSGWIGGTWTSGNQTLAITWSNGTREEFSASVYRNSYSGEMNLRLGGAGLDKPMILHRVGD